MEFYNDKKGVFAIYVLTNYKAEDDILILIVQLEDGTNKELMEGEKGARNTNTTLSNKAGR